MTFLSRLRGNLVRRGDNDKVVWKDDQKGSFFVKSFYEVLDVGRSSFQRTLFGIHGYPPKSNFLHGKLIRE